MQRLRSILLIALFCVLLLKLALQISLPHDWQTPLRIVIYPVNADGRHTTEQYIQALDAEHFSSIARFLHREAHRYQLDIAPVSVELGPMLAASPPLPPQQGNGAEYLNWSLKIRYWSWRNLPADSGDIRIYLRLFSPHHPARLAHSIGLKQGRIGLVNGYAAIDLQAQNNFVTAHELLHTLGASDKYDLNTRLPLFPEGYAEPQRQPALPQQQAEIMGGWIPVTIGHAVMPRGLDEAIIGKTTAHEIGW
ncbi:MAG: hypothetical protein OIF57_12330 [Marinobacterium sp.]|nr:hypothetical protein [Marinobacterium sp.]